MKERLKQSHKWILVLGIILAVTVPSNIYALDINSFIDLVPSLVNTAEGPSGVPTAEPAQRTKETCTTIPFIHKCLGPSLDHLAIILLRGVINKLSDFTVTFINNGFQSEGGAGYATDLGNTLTKELDVQAGNIIYGAGVGKLCSPFQQNVRLALIANEAARTGGTDSSSNAGSCTLSSVSKNIQGFMNGDFASGGGWDAWFTMTQDPYGNPYSAFLNTQAKIDTNQAVAVSNKQTQLSWNVGFFSTQDCLKWVDPDPTKSTGGSSKIVNGQLVVEPISLGAATASTPGAVCTQKGPVKTPGTVVQDDLKKVFGSKIDQLNVASNFNQIIVALAGQLEKLVFSKTTGIFANEASNNGTYNTNSTEGATNAGTSGTCSANVTTASAGTDVVKWTFTGVSSATNETYQWSGSEGLSGTNDNTSITYQTEGQKYASLLITDTLADGSVKTNPISCNGNVTVSKYPPLALTCNMVVDKTGRTDASMPVGQTATWTVTITGGSGQLHLIDLDEGKDFGVDSDNDGTDPRKTNVLAGVSPAVFGATFTRALSAGPVFWFNGGIQNGTYVPLPLQQSNGAITVAFKVLYTQTGKWSFGFDSNASVVDEDTNVPALAGAQCSNQTLTVSP